MELFKCSAWLFGIKSRRRKDVGNKITNKGFFCNVSQALWGCDHVSAQKREAYGQMLGSTSWLFLLIIVIMI